MIGGNGGNGGNSGNEGENNDSGDDSNDNGGDDTEIGHPLDTPTPGGTEYLPIGEPSADDIYVPSDVPEVDDSGDGE